MSPPRSFDAMLATHYDYRLVALSIFIAMCAAYAALGLAERVTATSKFKSLWVAGGACAMGLAIWSMHYIGMLAFQLPVAVHYDIPLVLLSMVAAILASALALGCSSQREFGPGKLVFASLAMGTGIVTMHYIGMAAMRMSCTCSYDWRIVTLSVVIAVVDSGVALAAFRYKTKLSAFHKFAAATLLGVAISSMHYTGMAAAHFWASNKPVNYVDTIGVSWLGGIGIAAGTLLLLSIAIISSIAGTQFSEQSNRLESTERRYRVLFERSLAGIYRANLDGTIIDMNDECVRLLGYKTRDQVLGKIIRNEHMSVEDRELYTRLLRETKRVPAREMLFSRADGSQVWVLAGATLLESQDGTPPEIQGTLLSIDELKRTENELRLAKCAAESASLAKSQFLTNMSHELRTPLNGVLGMTHLLMSTHLDREQQEYTQIVRSSAEELLGVINHILQFSTSELKGAIAESEEFDLRLLIRAELAAIMPAAEKKHLTVSHSIARDIAAAFWGEPGWIGQVISGLLSNAVKFTSHGEIALTASSCGRSGPNQILSISVRDTGAGIPLNKQNEIFEPFNQADNSNTRAFGGTGLGLSIVRNLTEAMGGRISVQSEPGQGSTFSVLLPLLVRQSAIPARTAEATEPEIAPACELVQA